MAIKYKNVINKLKDAGITQTAVRDAGLLSQSTLTRLRMDQSVTTDTIDILCQLLHCTPNDIMQVTYDE